MILVFRSRMAADKLREPARKRGMGVFWGSLSLGRGPAGIGDCYNPTDSVVGSTQLLWGLDLLVVTETRTDQRECIKDHISASSPIVRCVRVSPSSARTRCRTTPRRRSPPVRILVLQLSSCIPFAFCGYVLWSAANLFRPTAAGLACENSATPAPYIGQYTIVMCRSIVTGGSQLSGLWERIHVSPTQFADTSLGLVEQRWRCLDHCLQIR